MLIGRPFRVSLLVAMRTNFRGRSVVGVQQFHTEAISHEIAAPIFNALFPGAAIAQAALPSLELLDAPLQRVACGLDHSQLVRGSEHSKQRVMQRLP